MISPNWHVEFHVHTYASLIVVRVMLSHNLTGKSDQLVVYTYRLFNRVEYTYNTIEREALAIIFVLHKFKHYLLSNKFVVYVDHMTLVYMVNKPHVLGRITRWLLLFLEYDFIVVYRQNSCSCKCIVKIVKHYRTHKCVWSNHRCRFVLHKA